MLFFENKRLNARRWLLGQKNGFTKNCQENYLFQSVAVFSNDKQLACSVCDAVGEIWGDTKQRIDYKKSITVGLNYSLWLCGAFAVESINKFCGVLLFDLLMNGSEYYWRHSIYSLKQTYSNNGHRLSSCDFRVYSDEQTSGPTPKKFEQFTIF